jgi:hypothetical protein
LFETSDHEVVLRCAFGALWDRDEKAARSTAERVLREGVDPTRIACVLHYLEYAEQDLAPFAPAVLPLTISRSRTIAISACGFLAKQAATFHSFVDWVATRTRPDEQRRAVMALAPQIYWAYVANRDLQKELAAPLRSLRERAKAMKHAVGVKAIDAAAKKAGIVLGA